MQLKREYLAPKQDIKAQFECIYSNEIIDINNAYKCYECDAAVCADAFKKLSEKNLGCPSCYSTRGFKDSISDHHKELIKMIKFCCPNKDCGITLGYEDATRHIPRCLEMTRDNKMLKDLVESKDEKIAELNTTIKD